MRAKRAINQSQIQLYLREWGKVRVILRRTMSPKEADAQRHALTIQALGYDKSSKEFSNDELDKVLKQFRAISKPGDLHAQMDDQAANRGRFKVRQLLSALGKDEAHAEQLIDGRHAGDALVTVSAEGVATFENIGPADLERIALDLKEECRKRWPRKGDLLNEIRLMRMEFEFDEETANREVCAALGAERMPAVEALGYDELLKVIAAMRRIMNTEVPF